MNGFLSGNVGRNHGRGQPQLPEDRITLTGLEAFAHHGVFDFEREQGQRFLIDAEVAVGLSGTGDALDRTVHYGDLAEAIHAAVVRDPVDLLETVAERVAETVLAFEGARAVRVTVHKPNAPINLTFADVSVTVVRYADEQLANRSQGGVA